MGAAVRLTASRIRPRGVRCMSAVMGSRRLPSGIALARGARPQRTRSTRVTPGTHRSTFDAKPPAPYWRRVRLTFLLRPCMPVASRSVAGVRERASYVALAPATSAAGLGLAPATSAPGLGLHCRFACHGARMTERPTRSSASITACVCRFECKPLAGSSCAVHTWSSLRRPA